MFVVNGVLWELFLANPENKKLQRSDNVYTLGVTDHEDKTVYINNRLSYQMFDKVLSHEMVHVFSFSYDLYIPIEIEEIVADFLSTYGRDIFKVADDIMKKIFWVA